MLMEPQQVEALAAEGNQDRLPRLGGAEQGPDIVEPRMGEVEMKADAALLPTIEPKLFFEGV